MPTDETPLKTIRAQSNRRTSGIHIVSALLIVFGPLNNRCLLFSVPTEVCLFGVDNSCDACWGGLYILWQIVKWSEKDWISGATIWPWQYLIVDNSSVLPQCKFVNLRTIKVYKKSLTTKQDKHSWESKNVSLQKTHKTNWNTAKEHSCILSVHGHGRVFYGFYIRDTSTPHPFVSYHPLQIGNES